MIAAIVLVLALLLVAGGVAVLLRASARRRPATGGPADAGTLVADAQAQASAVVADTRLTSVSQGSDRRC